MASRRAALLGVAALAAGAAWAGVGAASATGSGTGAAHAFRHGLQGRPAASVAAAERAVVGGAAARAGQTLIVIERPGSEAGVDVPPKGYSPGDFFLFEGRLFDRTGSRLVGRDSVRCEAGIRAFTCEATGVIYGKGKIRVAGTFFTERDNVLPVTGGTGAYQGVGGELTVFDLPRGASVLVFHLVR